MSWFYQISIYIMLFILFIFLHFQLYQLCEVIGMLQISLSSHAQYCVQDKTIIVALGVSLATYSTLWMTTTIYNIWQHERNNWLLCYCRHHTISSSLPFKFGNVLCDFRLFIFCLQISTDEPVGGHKMCATSDFSLLVESYLD